MRRARGAGRAAQWSIRRRRGADVVCFLLTTKEPEAILLKTLTSQESSRHPNNIVNCYLRAARGRGLERDIYEVAD